VKVKSKGSFTLANKSCSYPDSLNNATSNGIVPFFVVTQGAKASKVLAFFADDFPINKANVNAALGNYPTSVWCTNQLAVERITNYECLRMLYIF
jgi:hypothetical protein